MAVASSDLGSSPSNRTALAAGVTSGASLAAEEAVASSTLRPLEAAATATTTEGPSRCAIYGLPKLTWAIVADLLALLLVLLCVPLALMCARRRPPGTPMFDFSCGSSGSSRQQARGIIF